eukprot:351138-Chlamydomonas_euryale.AAC.17
MPKRGGVPRLVNSLEGMSAPRMAGLSEGKGGEETRRGGDVRAAVKREEKIVWRPALGPAVGPRGFRVKTSPWHAPMCLPSRQLCQSIRCRGGLDGQRA